MIINNLREAALYYAELDYRVFPCSPGAKTPLTQHGFHDATDDCTQIEGWWNRHPNANIGLATAGLIVLDIDGDRNSWLHDRPDLLLDLAAGPMAITPRGGSHRIFRQPHGKKWRCSESRLAPGVDTRGEGGYIVVPPSVVNGKPYRWGTGQDLFSVRDNLPEPPLWLISKLDHLGNITATLAAVGHGTNESNEIPSGQRNATLAKLAGTMRRVGMSQKEIGAALQRVNADRCVPPLPTKEVERIAASISRYEPDQIAVAVMENHWGQIQRQGEAEEPDNPDPGPIPDNLLSVPGFIGEVMDYTLATAPYPERNLAFCGALVLQALLAGRKVRDTADNRTNLYILGLANSGAGKDYPRKVNQRILVEAGLAQCLGNSFASGEGIEDSLFVQPTALFQVDELDSLLLRVNQAKDARHEQIVNILLQMYSSASSVYVMRAKAGRERAVIDQPCLCIFGTAVPKHFFEAMSPRFMTNGFLARMLVFESSKRGQGRDVEVEQLPSSVLDIARWWMEYLPGDSPGNLAQWHPVPQVIDQSAEAKETLASFRDRADSEYAQAEAQNDPAGMAIWARAYEKSRRLALIFACSENHLQPRIHQPAAAWACQVVEHQTRRMLFLAGCHASEGDFDAKRKRILEVLAKWKGQQGDAWMPFWKINRKLPWPRRDHEDIRRTLLSQRLIEVQSIQSGGRPGEVYRLIPSVSA